MKLLKAVVAVGILLLDGAIGVLSNAVGLALLVGIVLVGAYAIADKLVDRLSASLQPAHPPIVRGVC